MTLHSPSAVSQTLCKLLTPWHHQISRSNDPAKKSLEFVVNLHPSGNLNEVPNSQKLPLVVLELFSMRMSQSLYHGPNFNICFQLSLIII